MKTQKTTILYWSAISFMSLWFATSGILELAHSPIVWDITVQLGYPPHFIYLLGVFKLAGVLTLLVPNKLLRLKEWVFAGMFFDILFAFFSKISVSGCFGYCRYACGLRCISHGLLGLPELIPYAPRA